MASFTCNHCVRTTHEPVDVLSRYCGWCRHHCDDHEFWLSEEDRIAIKFATSRFRRVVTVRVPALEADD